MDIDKEDIEYCIRDIISQVRIVIKGLTAGSKKIQLDNGKFTVTGYLMGSIQNIRIDIKDNK